MIALPPLAELTLLCKLSDMTEPSLGTSLFGMGLFMDHVFLKHTWNTCFALCLLLMVAWLSAWASRCIPAAGGCCSVKIPDKLTALLLLMALMWSVSFTHGCGWGIQRVCVQGNAALMFCFYTHRNSEWAMGHHYSVRGSWSWSYKSIWRWFPLESQIAQKQLHVPLSMPFLSFMCHC